MSNKPIRRIAIIGTGVIGASLEIKHVHGANRSFLPTAAASFRCCSYADTKALYTCSNGSPFNASRLR